MNSEVCVTNLSATTVFRGVFAAGAMSLVLWLCGCSGGDGRTPLAGKVTFGGSPLPYGEIVFQPEVGPQGTATIRNGLYDTNVDGGQGIIPGKLKILITGYQSEPAAVPDETAATTAAPPLFVNFQLETAVSGSPFDIEIPADAVSSGK